MFCGSLGSVKRELSCEHALLAHLVHSPPQHAHFTLLGKACILSLLQRFLCFFVGPSKLLYASMSEAQWEA